MATWNEVLSGEQTPQQPLTTAYRIVRVLGAGEGPISGVLAHGSDGAVVLVDAERLQGWPGWELAGQHVLSPLDVARTNDGHQVVLAWCPHLLTLDWARGPISGGEAVTLAVSLLRGTVEARAGARGADDGPTGRWWADDAGRPVFAPSLPPAAGGGTYGGDESAAAGARRLVAAVGERTTDRVVRRLLDRVGEVLADPSRLAREPDALEAELFEACAPQPLSFVGVTEESSGEPELPDARQLRSHATGLRRDRPGQRRGRRRRGDQRRRDGTRADASRARDSERRRLDPRALAEDAWSGSLGAAVSDVLFHVRESARRLGGGRRAAYLAGGAAAIAVLLVGLLWPSGEPTAVADERGGEASEAAPTPERASDEDREADAESRDDGDAAGHEPTEKPGGGDATAGEEAVPGSADDAPEEDAPEEGAPEKETEVVVEAEPADAAHRLIERAVDCVAANDDACEGAVEAGSGTLRDDTEVWPALSGADLTLADDYGGVALVRADLPEGDVHFLILVQHDGRWLLRDAYAAA